MHLRDTLHLIAREARHHPGRVGVALLAIALGVALAFAVHLINASALAEFGQAVRSVNGQPDVELRPVGRSGLDEVGEFPLFAALHQLVGPVAPGTQAQRPALGSSCARPRTSGNSSASSVGKRLRNSSRAAMSLGSTMDWLTLDCGKIWSSGR